MWARLLVSTEVGHMTMPLMPTSPGSPSPSPQAVPVERQGWRPLREWLADWASNLLVMLLVWSFLAHAPYFRKLLGTPQTWPGTSLQWTSLQVLAALMAIYAVTLPLYHAGSSSRASAYLFWRGMWTGCRDAEWQLAGRTLALKAFFVPLMVHWLVGHLASLTSQIHRLASQGWADAFQLPGLGLFGLAFSLLLLVDVACFTLGYLVESKRMGNPIRSVDPTASGWAVCLLCYPPFNGATDALLGWVSSDHPVVVGQPWLTVALNAVMLATMAVYASASLALGFKASNLTSRGVVQSGPYRWVRHPAYAAKNLAWWLGAVPAVLAAQGMAGFGMAMLSVAGWTGLYVLRALTEERHLRATDPAYELYAQRVRWRFVPGLI
jgi:protein-S-isoprenylcysteine O-methyltransferase Ste14